MTVAGDRLKGRVAIVTGGAGGIGVAIVQRFLDEGAFVVSTVSSAERANELRKAVTGDRLATIETDVTSEQSCNDLVKQADKLCGRVDILVNNAGIFPAQPLEQMSYADWRQVINVNLDGVFLVTRAVVPVMKRNGWGRIVMMSSATVWLGTPGYSHYAAAKAGVIGFMRCLASEVGQFGITANALTPGLTSTDMVVKIVPNELLERRSAQRAMRRQLFPPDIVGTVLFLSSDDSAMLTGQTINIDGGITMR
jgi:3-oxoacyl-[acyl-carrier protein] reductase